MNILIVDGNERKASNSYTEMGMPTQFEIYEDVLRSLIKKDCKITILHPACSDNYMPKGVSLDDFDGIVWTGSLLNIYDLGELWFKDTSLPFTFSTFNYYGEVPSSEEINILHESYSEGSKNLSLIVDDFLINSKFKIEKKIAEAYLQERIIYKITEKHLEGINLFNKLSSKFANWEKNSFNNTDK